MPCLRPIPIRPCRGPSRRDRSGPGLLGALGLGLDDLLRLRAGLGRPVGRRPSAKARSCILVWLAGGPSHIDTFDPKPDAPADVRGEFKPIDTAVPGLQISEVFPKLAKVMDRVTLIRSVTSPEADHDRAAHHLLTGYRPSPALVYPSYGSVVAKAREVEPRGAAPVRGHPRRAALLVERLPDAGLRPVRRRGRPEPGGLPGPRPDPARPPDPRPAPPPPGDGPVARRLRPRRPGDPADHQPRPVRRPGVRPADLERRPGRVQDRRRARRRSATGTAGPRSASRACSPAG